MRLDNAKRLRPWQWALLVIALMASVIGAVAAMPSGALHVSSLVAITQPLSGHQLADLACTEQYHEQGVHAVAMTGQADGLICVEAGVTEVGLLGPAEPEQQTRNTVTLGCAIRHDTRAEVVDRGNRDYACVVAFGKGSALGSLDLNSACANWRGGWRAKNADGTPWGWFCRPS